MIINNLKSIKTSTVIKGTLILTVSGILTRIIGFFFRIFLSRTIGAEGIGIFQLISPILIISLAISVGGVQTIISKMVAETNEDNSHKKLKILICGSFISVFLAVCLGLFLFLFSDFIAINILFEQRCSLLIKWTGISLPLCALHNCICGYYIGIRQTSVPAISQLLEQCVRVLSILIIYFILSNSGKSITPTVAIIGEFFGEIASTTYSVLSFRHFKIKKQKPTFNTKFIIRPLIYQSVPLTLNRVFSSLLYCIQNIIIPGRLVMFGLSTSKALSLYGIITGMVMPLILFPNAIINSISTLLIPTVAEAKSKNNVQKLSFTSSMTLCFCMIFGIFCSGFFMIFHNEIGILLFNNKETCFYIFCLGILCPLIYCTSTINSILNGLGKTTLCLIHNSISMGIQIFCTIFFVPIFGILGYILGMLSSHIVCVLLMMVSLRKYIRVNYDFIYEIILPLTTIYLSSNLIKQIPFEGNMIILAKFIVVGGINIILDYYYFTLFRKKIF